MPENTTIDDTTVDNTAITSIITTGTVYREKNFGTLKEMVDAWLYFFIFKRSVQILTPYFYIFILQLAMALMTLIPILYL